MAFRNRSKYLFRTIYISKRLSMQTGLGTLADRTGCNEPP